MGVKADLKVARARMQSGEPGQALSMIQKILDGGSPELQDVQTLYAVLVSAGVAGLASDDLSAAERSFRRAAESLPDSPQAWKGLIDCLERAGRVEDLPECLSRAASIAEGKRNHCRVLSLLLRQAEVLDGLGRPGEALDALRRHLDNPEAVAAVAGGASPAAERLSASLLAALLEVSREDAAVSERVKKRLLKDSGGGIVSATVTKDSPTRARSALALEYRSKALVKDDEQRGPVCNRLDDALRALDEVVDVLPPDVDSQDPRQPSPLRALVARFCRTFLGRALQRAESKDGRESAWDETAAACATVRAAVRGGGWDEGWADAVFLMSSAYRSPLDAAELRRVAEDGARDDLRPWLFAESCLYLAAVAVSTGAGAEGSRLLDAAAAAVARDGGSSVGNSTWAGMSSRGSNWRELSLRCLADEHLGYPGGGRGDPKAALGYVESAIAAYEDSCDTRGAPAGTSVFNLRGSLELARASLLLRLGCLEDARASIATATSMASDGRDGDVTSEAETTSKEGLGEADPTRGLTQTRSPPLRFRALCVASDVDATEGNVEAAKEKLREVLDATGGGLADALSRLGWLLLVGNANGSESAAGGKGGAKAARPLLEKAAIQEPGSSRHAFQLARCYWEAGDEFRTDRNFCFNNLLKAAKLDPSNAQAFEWLGYWYGGVVGDRDRAQGCFQRAIKLDPLSQGAGEALAALYLEKGQETLAVSLFRQCAASSVACHWAWAALARSEILEGKLTEASAHLQQAIRGFPTCWDYWSDLGWCYHSEGKLAAALKAYTRADELLAARRCVEDLEGSRDGESPQEARADTAGDNPLAVSVGTGARKRETVAHVRVKTQVGAIQRSIGQVDEAVESFSAALEISSFIPDPSGVVSVVSGLALAGAGEAYLAQAHARTSEGLYTAAATALHRGCDTTRRFLDGIGAGSEQEEEKLFALKLLGDLHTYGHKLPPMVFKEEGTWGTTNANTDCGVDGGQGEGGSLRKLGTKEAASARLDAAKKSSRNRIEFVARGADAYQQLVQLLRDDEWKKEDSLSPALYDLGLNHLLRARLVCAEAGEGSGLWPQEDYENIPEAAELASLAEVAFKQSIQEDPSLSDAWNGLGAVSRDPLMSQHCWVRAVQLGHNPSAWANLGMLYIRWGLDAQAYDSFGGLQAVTDHPVMWIGLGLLKEKEACRPTATAAKRRKLLSQASDAYYSSLETGQHAEGLLGLGTIAGRTHSQADALVALQQHLDLSPSSAQACNHLGAAAELAGRGTQAVAAYRVALGLLEEQGARMGKCKPWEEAVRIVRGNLARALVLCGEAEEAACLLEQQVQDGAEAENLLQLGRARAVLGDWDAALNAFHQASASGVPEISRLISSAIVLYLRGDATGASPAAADLLNRHEADHRVLLTALSLGVLASDEGHEGVAQRAARLLSRVHRVNQATVPGGRGTTRFIAEKEEALWATHLAMRASGAPESLSRRALCKAVHLSPASVQSWTRLGAAVADSSAGVHNPSFASPIPRDARPAPAAAALAEVCFVAAEKQADAFLRMGKARRAVGVSSATGGEADTAVTVDVSAAELSSTLAGIAKTVLLGGKPGSVARAVKAAVRAVHVCPGDVTAWRCLGAALVAQALSSPLDSSDARASLADARTVYRGIAEASGVSSDSWPGGLEADYATLLLGDAGSSPASRREERSAVEEATQATRFPDCSEVSFASAMSAARASLCAERSEEQALAHYKRAVRMRPRSLTAWCEIAACYHLLGHFHAAVVALECGLRVSSSGDEGLASATVAPLHLQSAATKLFLPGRAGEALESVGNAFRLGRGGVVGHVLRGILSARLGKAALAKQAFGKAKEADPAIAGVVEKVASAVQVSESSVD